MTMPTLQSMRISLRTIRGRLWAGSLVIVALLLAAGGISWRTMSTMSQAITVQLNEVQSESRLGSQLASDAAKTLEAGGRYLETRDPEAESSFRQHGWNAHVIQRSMNTRSGRTADEIATVATIDTKLSEMEVRYALSHRLADLGRVAEAHREANRAQDAIDGLLSNIDRLGLLKAQRVTVASQHLTDETAQRSATLLGSSLVPPSSLSGSHSSPCGRSAARSRFSFIMRADSVKATSRFAPISTCLASFRYSHGR